jgi:hypothetical protein
MLVTMLPSHAGDDATEATWSWRDVEDESCWRQCYRVLLLLALQLKVVLVVIRLHSPRAQSVKLWSHREEIRYSCWLIAEL